AVPLSTAVVEAIDALQQHLKRDCPKGAVRWVQADHIHLTLHFLGDILLDRVDPVKAALRVVARNVPVFEFEAAGLGAFPNEQRPRVIWVGVQDTTSWLALLHEAVNEAMGRLGFEREKRRFSPHLTLGRVQRRASYAEARTIGEVIGAADVDKLGTVPVKKLIFFQSVLRPSGAEYTPLAEFPLVEPPA
ncbi:MAG: RNA 2',3'-cyclic phosphodiesterase, partial [Anaerolineae bacterium]|nr:RNA 2',3'-cyclic phosphodiesterase [Anaerolineae bacterium]